MRLDMLAHNLQRFGFRWPGQQQHRILEAQKRVDHFRERASRPASLCVRRTRMDSYWRLKKTEAIAALPAWRNIIAQDILDARSLQTNGLRHEISNMHITDFDRSFWCYKHIPDTHLAHIQRHFTANIHIPVDNAIGPLDHISRTIIVNTHGC